MNPVRNNRFETIDSLSRFSRGEGTPLYPAELFLEVSTVCNLRCIMCAPFSALLRGPSRGHGGGLMDFDLLSESLDSVLPHVLNVHCFGFGEPTLHPSFSEILTGLTRYEVLIDFFTNGMMMDQSLVDLLVDLRVYKVTFSLSGCTREQYESIYVGGSWEKVCSGVRRLARKKQARGVCYPMIAINSLAFPDHLETLGKFVRFWADAGVDIIQLSRIVDHENLPQLRRMNGAGLWGPTIRNLDRIRAQAKRRGVKLNTESLDDYRPELSADFQEGRFMPPSASCGSTPPARVSRGDQPVELQPETHGDDLVFLPPPKQLRREGFFCLEPFKTLFVHRNGEVKPCCSTATGCPPLGDLTTQSAAAVWQGDLFETVRGEILRGRYPMALCRECLKCQGFPKQNRLEELARLYSDWAGLDSHARSEGLRRTIPEIGRAFGLEPEPAAESEADHPGADEIIRMLQGLEEPEPNYVEGFLDGISEEGVWGWAWSPVYPRVRVPVQLRVDGRVLAEVAAAEYRADLEAAGKGDGRHGFSFELSEPLLQSAMEVRVQIPSTQIDLTNSPLCPSTWLAADELADRTT